MAPLGMFAISTLFATPVKVMATGPYAEPAAGLSHVAVKLKLIELVPAGNVIAALVMWIVPTVAISPKLYPTPLWPEPIPIAVTVLVPETPSDDATTPVPTLLLGVALT